MAHVSAFPDGQGSLGSAEHTLSTRAAFSSRLKTLRNVPDTGRVESDEIKGAVAKFRLHMHDTARNAGKSIIRQEADEPAIAGCSRRCGADTIWHGDHGSLTRDSDSRGHNLRACDDGTLEFSRLTVASEM
ncbi:phosphate acetyltransferase [Marssonina coronariae]|uniref:Phosphate acetyltransferase n=1 Tax=Diplocarpon coronariae TaxID=2795749 RepID=A0A218ZCR2_9HELO|nr:phosphate acetyltransferase [Marssonina coronariae]